MLSKNGKTFDLRALGGIFVENLDGGQFILLYDRAFHIDENTCM